MSTPRTRRLALAGTAALAAIALLASCAGQSAVTDDAAAGDPVEGRTLTYLEHQAHTTLYPPQAGFYPNGGIVNNVTARLTWQDPDVARDRALGRDGVDGERGRHRVHVRPARRRDLLRRNAARRGRGGEDFDTYGLGDKELGLTISEAINNYASSEVVDADTVTFRFSAPRRASCRRPRRSTRGCSRRPPSTASSRDFGAGSSTEIVGSGPFVITEEEIGTLAPPRGP